MNINKIIKEKLITSIVPPNNGTVAVCFFNLLSGLSKTFMKLDSFFKLIKSKQFKITNPKNMPIILKCIFYTNIDKGLYYNIE